MGYLHINNLYRDTRILEFKQVYCLEKIHGTSAHVGWKDGRLNFYSGGEKYKRFVSIFDEEKLATLFKEHLGAQDCVVFGEAYGGKLQGMKATYGEQLKFVVFDIKIENSWLDVPKAFKLSRQLGFEFVYWELVSSDLKNLNIQRDFESTQAIRNGIGIGKKREGIVIRPPFEVKLNNGKRLIAKHKRDDFRETKTKRVVGKDLQVLKEAEAIADEWVTPGRMENILSKKQEDFLDLKNTGEFIKIMTADIEREASNEIEMSKAAKKAIGKAAAKLFKTRTSKI